MVGLYAGIVPAVLGLWLIVVGVSSAADPRGNLGDLILGWAVIACGVALVSLGIWGAVVEGE